MRLLYIASVYLHLKPVFKTNFLITNPNTCLLQDMNPTSHAVRLTDNVLGTQLY